MPKFNDSENLIPFVAPGDYTYTVTGFSQGISAGGKTSGATKYELELSITMPDGSRGPLVFENLIDHDLCAWKIDTFIKSAGVVIPKGAGYEFNQDDAKTSGVPFVNPLGLRGWLCLNVEEYNGKKRNKVATFYTNKPKLARVEIEATKTDSAVESADIPF